jgi:electron transfer flavoprotein beta subunit
VNILVVMRMMPDPAGDFEVLSDGAGLDREWMDFQLNDFDDQALEEAILLKEACGARVTAVAIGEGANRVLQMAVARGADEVLVIIADHGELMSSQWLATTVVALARERGSDLILSGVQAAEDLFGQFAPYAGAMLDWPHLSGTSRLAWSDGALHVAQERGGGVVANYRVAPPAVLGVQTATKAPRYVSGSKLREASKAAIGRVNAAAPAFHAGVRVAGLSLPVQGSGAESLGSAPEHAADRIAGILAERGLTGGRPR